jgi:hypothetical protein
MYANPAKQMTLTLEGERIEYLPQQLVARLQLCLELIKIVGKPALQVEPSTSLFGQIARHYPGTWEELVGDWGACWRDPLSRLAVWLSPSKTELAGKDDARE